LIAFGSADPAIVEARDRLSKQGIETDYLRLRALPLEQTLTDFISRHDHVYVVELNYDGQMCQLIRLHVPEMAAKVRSIAYCDGLPLTARFVTEAILRGER
jgi:2-oxoglutarate ferredoxin oxidoreductase subunit alpha